MKKTLIALGVAMLAQGYALQSSAAVLDFESLAHADDQLADAGWVYLEEGFKLENASANAFSTWGSLSPFFSGSTALMNDNDGGLTTLTHASNSAFSLYSVTLSTMFPGISEDGAQVTFSGLRQDNSTVSQTFNIADGAAQTVSFASGFTNLAVVTWTNDASYHQFDNITVAAVPEPETYAMFLAGLGLLGLVARRRGAR